MSISNSFSQATCACGAGDAVPTFEIVDPPDIFEGINNEKLLSIHLTHDKPPADGPPQSRECFSRKEIRVIASQGQTPALILQELQSDELTELAQSIRVPAIEFLLDKIRKDDIPNKGIDIIPVTEQPVHAVLSLLDANGNIESVFSGGSAKDSWKKLTSSILIDQRIYVDFLNTLGFHRGLSDKLINAFSSGILKNVATAAIENTDSNSFVVLAKHNSDCEKRPTKLHFSSESNQYIADLVQRDFSQELLNRLEQSPEEKRRTLKYVSKNIGDIGVTWAADQLDALPVLSWGAGGSNVTELGKGQITGNPKGCKILDGRFEKLGEGLKELLKDRNYKTANYLDCERYMFGWQENGQSGQLTVLMNSHKEPITISANDTVCHAEKFFQEVSLNDMECKNNLTSSDALLKPEGLAKWVECLELDKESNDSNWYFEAGIPKNPLNIFFAAGANPQCMH